MAEALVIAGFLGLLVVLQVKDQKKIIVAAQTSWIRMGFEYRIDGSDTCNLLAK